MEMFCKMALQLSISKRTKLNNKNKLLIPKSLKVRWSIEAQPRKSTTLEDLELVDKTI